MSAKFDDELQWRIQRYVAGDETFDRDTFEAEMLEDTSLALAVADAVEELGQISAATHLAHASQASSAAHGNSAKSPQTARLPFVNWWRMAASLAALMLISFMISRGDFLGTQTANQEPNFQSPLSDVAENWLVLNEPTYEEAIVSDLIPPESLDFAPATDLENDWMAEATFALYDELDS